MYRATRVAAAASPKMQIAPETTPVKYSPHMLGRMHEKWFDGKSMPYRAAYRERMWLDMWPVKRGGWEKSGRPLVRPYSPAALREAQALVPAWFQASDVPRPPQRIRALSEGIVGRWYTNYWTLHSVKYQCQLAGIPWRHGERERPVSNYDEPFYHVDYEESKALRDYRTRWINVHRSMAGMSKRVKEVEEENRYVAYKSLQDKFWGERRVLVNRVKSMRSSGIFAKDDLPSPTMHLRAFE